MSTQSVAKESFLKRNSRKKIDVKIAFDDKQHTRNSVAIVISEFAELNKVQRPYLWPDDYSSMRMSRLVAEERLPTDY